MRPLPTRLVATLSSDQPPPDELRLRWRRRPVLAFLIRAFVLLAPLTAAVVVGIVASRQFRPRGFDEVVLWALWTAAASLLALWVVDVAVRRLLPLQRLLQLCLAFPDRAPSRLRVAVRAAVPRRPEALINSDDASGAAAVAEQVVTLLAALTLHDRRTRGHSERVCALTNLLATQMHLTDDDCDRLTWVALVHDIGKLHVPSRLLNKPDKPTVSEWQLLKTHPERGAALTAPMRDWLGPWADAVLQHHERYDGTGYPRGIAGEEISMAARMIAVTDAFEVMTAPRAYRRPVDAQTARAELARHAGDQFDPVMVRHFLAIGLPQLRRAMGPLAWLAEIPFVSSWPRLEAAASTTAAHAATATAAASAAGVLALGTGGGSTAAATTGVSGDIATSALGPTVNLPTSQVAAVHPTSTTETHTHAAAPAAHVRRTTVHSHADAMLAQPATSVRGTHAVRTHDKSAAAPAATSAPTYSRNRSGSDSSGSYCHHHHHHGGSYDGDDHGDDGDHHDDGGHDGRGHAYGHDHARGWQKNWGDNGRHPGHHH